jgi:glycosyltransferase involved in cell wall biosynthesis
MTLRTLLIGPRGHGGEGVYMHSLREHPPRGVEYAVADTFHEGAPGAPCARTLEVALNQIVRRAAIPDMGFRALRLREPFDLVHVHAHPVVLSGLKGTALVMSEGSSSAVYLSDYLGWDEARLTRRYRRARRLYHVLGIHDRLLSLDRVNRAYVFSHWARELNIRWGADPAKLEVIYPGFPTPSLPEPEWHENFTFLFVGSDFERKGGFEVVAAFAQLAADDPRVRLVVAGSDSEERNPDRLVHSWVPETRRLELAARLRDLERAGKIMRIAWVEQKALRESVFPAADAFVMPTYAEGFGFTNVEAMSFGLPVITSTVGPASEIVEHGVTGLLVTPGDVGALHDAMAKLAAEPTYARQLGERGRAHFQAKFTLARFCTELGDLYRRAVSG